MASRERFSGPTMVGPEKRSHYPLPFFHPLPFFVPSFLSSFLRFTTGGTLRFSRGAPPRPIALAARRTCVSPPWSRYTSSPGHKGTESRLRRFALRGWVRPSPRKNLRNRGPSGGTSVVAVRYLTFGVLMEKPLFVPETSKIDEFSKSAQPEKGRSTLRGEYLHQQKTGEDRRKPAKTGEQNRDRSRSTAGPDRGQNALAPGRRKGRYQAGRR